ncbi:T9SS sorting signal type C domain-containing protein [Flavobacterium sp. WC2429]|uniref:T9SS sorting signal type C domain-containing protein n=1 Tax=Flavobacterium sp. WC2429 TaxID=3234140 RepID=A0AB39WPC3_9FLAO
MNRILLFLILLPVFSFGQTSPQNYSSPGNFTFTVPTGVTSITVQTWGAGEDGVDASRRVTGGGGGGGAYAESTFIVTSGNSYRIVVGLHGSVGENSSIALSASQNTLIVKAEGGGQANNYKGGRASNSIGDIRYSGGDGYSSNSIYGGGGGSAGSNGNGSSANGSNSGNGGNGISGDGGNYNSAGGNPGGGGGEYSSFDGGNGRVIISWCTTPTTANAGVDQSQCNSGSFTLAGNTATVGTGGWSVVSGTATITTPSSKNSGVTGVPSGSSTTLRWTINGSCATSIDDVVLTNITASAVGSVSANQTICSGSSPVNITIVSATGIIQWQRADNATFTTNLTNVGANSTTLTSAQIGTLTATRYFRAVVTSGSCSAITSGTVTVSVNPVVKITLGSNPSMVQGSATTLNLPYTLNNGEQSNVTFDAAAIAAGITGFQSTSISGTSGNIVLQLPYCLKAGTYSGTMNVNTYTPINCTSVNYPFSIIITSSPAPTGTATQSFCSGATVANLVPNLGGASSIKWYDAAIGGNLLTSGTVLTTATHYYASQTSAGCESTARLDVTVTLTTANTLTLTSAAATTGQTVCINSPITNITYSTTGATGISNNNVTGANGLPAGVKAVWASSTITIIGTPTGAVGTYNYSIPLTGGCGNVSATGSIIVSTASVVPTTIAGTTTICMGSSTSLTVTGGTLGGGATAKWYSGSCGGTLVGSGNTISVSPTITTTYYVRYEGSCNSTACISTTVTVNPSLSNNNLSFSSGNSGQVNATAAEGGNAVLTAPSGTYFSNVAFASYGTPNGTSPNFTIGSCHATSSQSVTEGYLLGNNSATIPANNGVFGDPCVGTVKKVYILASYIEPICNGSKATLTGSTPSGGTGTYAYLWESSTTSATTGFSAATGTNNTINYTSGSITQTTWFRRTVTSCTLSSTSAVVMIKVNGTNSWNGTVWSKGVVPTLSDQIIFSGDYNVDADVNGCSCTVSGSKNVVIKAGRTMKIVNEVTVLGTGAGAGKLTFENSASLVQVNDAAVNTGTITYIRYTSSVLNSDYTYWSSPVTGQNLNISPSYSSGLAYSYNDFATPENWAGEQFSAIMQPGKGYIINGNQGFSSSPPSVYQATFVGVPNNGKIVLPIGPTGTSNLVGNPYPSAINGALFLSGNNLNIEGTIYIWTHNTAIQLASNISNGTAGSGAYAYTSDDYASYNGTGAVATSGGTVPTGNIAAGQSFFTTSLGTNPVTFSNSMRLSGTTIADGSGINQQFFKIKNAKYETEKPIEKDRVWLNLTNTQGAFKQTLIGYITDATNEYDSAFDGESFDSNEYLDFYSINQDKNLVIQGRALPFDVKDEVPLGYSSTIVGDFEIAIGQVDGALVDKEVFLEDKLLNTTHNLKNSPYLFKTEDGIFNERFILSYSNKTLATDDFENLKYGVVISNKNKEIQIKSSDDLIDKIFVYDFSGKQLYKKIKVDNIEYTIPNLGPTDQALIVKVVLQNGQTVNKKIVY